jgi:hypothetical protein
LILIYFLMALSPMLAGSVKARFPRMKGWWIWLGLSVLAPVSLMMYFNFERKSFWLGTHAHVPVLFGLLYLCLWIGISTLKSKGFRFAALIPALPLHLYLCLIGIMPGIWILGDFTSSSRPIYEDGTVKSFVMPWGWVGSSGFDLYVCEYDSFPPKILFFKRMNGFAFEPDKFRLEAKADGRYSFLIGGMEYVEFGIRNRWIEP